MKNASNISDNELLQMYFKTDNLDYIGILFKRYTRILIGVSLKYTSDLHHAEDVVQQVFIKFLDAVHPQIANVGGWLYQMTKNESINFTKKQGRQQIQHLEREEYHLSDTTDDEIKALLYKEHQSELLMAAISELKSDQRKAIECFYFHNLSYEQIAVQNNWSIGEVKSYIQNAKRNLKIKLQDVINSKDI